MADDENDKRTDQEAAKEDMDGMPLFTPKTSPGDPYHPDGVTYAYRDMRAQWWMVKYRGATSSMSGAWTATPTRATAELYGLEPKRMFAAASDAAGMIDAIEERIEAARAAAAASGGGGWLLLLLLAAIVFDDSNKRGRR